MMPRDNQETGEHFSVLQLLKQWPVVWAGDFFFVVVLHRYTVSRDRFTGGWTIFQPSSCDYDLEAISVHSKRV